MHLKRIKYITFLTLVSFIGSTLQPAYALNSYYSFSVFDSLIQPNGFETVVKSLPSELGDLVDADFGVKIKDQEKGTSKPFVIHIQDAHSNPEAQAGIRAILHYLSRDFNKIRNYRMTVAIEGAVGRIHPEYLDLVPEISEINEKLIRGLIGKGELNGTDLFAWDLYRETLSNEYHGFVFPYDLREQGLPGVLIAGAEDSDLYRRNLERYRGLLFKQTEIAAKLEPVRKKMEVAESKVFNPALRQFLAMKKSKNSRLLSYATQSLPDAAMNELKINLQDPLEQLRFPSLSRLAVIQKMEQQEDLNLAKNEWGALKGKLDGRPQVRNAVQILDKMFHLDNSRSMDFRKALKNLSQFVTDKNLLEKFPHWKAHVAAVILRNELDALKLMDEISRLEDAVARKLTQSDEEKRLLDLGADFEALCKLLRLELSREEYDGIRLNASQIDLARIAGVLADILSEGPAVSGEEIRGEIEEAFAFYDGAKSRDAVLVSNALALSEQFSTQPFSDGSGEEPPQEIIFLITGGFHTEGIRSILRSKNLPYAVISPRIRELDGGERYQRVMRRENAGMTEYFPGAPVPKQAALFFKGLVETAAPEMVNRYGLPKKQVSAWISDIVARHPVLKNYFEGHTFPGTETYPFVRIGIKSADSSAPALNQSTVSEVDLLQFAGNYPVLSGERLSPVFSRFYRAVRLSPGQGPYLVRRPETIPAASQLGGIKVSTGVIKGPRAEGRKASPVLANPRSEVRSDTPVTEIKEPEIRTAIFGENIDLPAYPTLYRAHSSLTLMETNAKAGVERRLKRAARQLKAKEKLQVSVEKYSQEKLDALVNNHDVIFITAPVREGVSYEEYKQQILSYAEKIGLSLKKLREQELASGAEKAHKVFVVRTWVGVETSEEIFDRIQKASGKEDDAFDVVYQPDFSFRTSKDVTVENQIVFGLRHYNQLNISDAELARRDRTETSLRRTFNAAVLPDVKVTFMDLRSAEQSKDALLLYLAGKIAHFNDLAMLSRRFGADLSAIAYGAGLDKRIRKLFTNPSLGFGGRLGILLDWIYAERLNRAVRVLEGQTVGTIQESIERSLRDLRNGKSIQEILDKVPVELHFLIWLQNIREVNRRNQQDFYQRIVRGVEQKMKAGSLSDKKVALIGAGYREGDRDITNSPAKTLIQQLVNKGVKTFYISDPVAGKAFKEWVLSIRNNLQHPLSDKFKNVKFYGYGIEGGDDTTDLSIYDAAAKADLTILATDSHPGLASLDVQKLSEALAGKPFFDGINLFGLHANGSFEPQYSFAAIRSADIHYISVGRPSIRSRAVAEKITDDYTLTDSIVVGRDLDRKNDADKLRAVREYENILLRYGADDSQRGDLIRIFNQPDQPEKLRQAQERFGKHVAVLGSGYVGATTGANLADLGHSVRVVDIPQKQNVIDGLNSAETTVLIHEPGLRDWIIRGKQSGKLKFTTDAQHAIEESEIVYLAVGTPQQDDGEMDPRYILQAARQVGEVIKAQMSRGEPAFKTIVIKSTVTPEIFEMIEAALKNEFGLIPGEHYGLASNPEFLREGQAIRDITTELDRTVLGLYSKMNENGRARVEQQLLELWYPLMLKYPHEVLVTDTATSTLIKYAANGGLAYYVTATNILAENSALVGADFEQVILPLRNDPRIGPNAFLFCGPGYGGSCFPKDVRALHSISNREAGTPLLLILAADEFNHYYKTVMVRDLIHKLEPDFPDKKFPLKSRHIALWGIAFKPDTDDVRETPTADIVYELIRNGAETVRLHDPIFNTPNAPPQKVVAARFTAELYKHFKKDPGFETSFRIFQKSQRVKDGNYLKRLFQLLRYDELFRESFRTHVGQQPDAFEQDFGRFFSAQKPEDPWGSQLSSAANLRDYLTTLAVGDRVPELFQKEAYFYEIYFTDNFLKTNRIQFFQDHLESLRASGVQPEADALMIVTDWRDYKAVPVQLFSGFVTIDTRNIFYSRRQEFHRMGIDLVGPGRPQVGRSEVRDIQPESVRFHDELRKVLSAVDSTESLRSKFTAASTGYAAYRNAGEIETRRPDLILDRRIAETLTGAFYDPELLRRINDLEAWRYLQLVLGRAEQDYEAGKILEALKSALGPYQWLLDTGALPVRIASPANKREIHPNDAMGFYAFLLSNPSGRLIVPVSGVNQNDAKALQAGLIKNAKRFRIQNPEARIMVTYDTSEGAKAFARLIGQSLLRERDTQSGVLDDRMELLDHLDVGRFVRIFHGEQIDENSAILLTAALLREQFGDKYQIVDIENWLRGKGIDTADLVKHVGQMIQVMKHIASQA